MHLEAKTKLDLHGRIAVHFRGRTLNSFPLWKRFVGKDSCALKEEESLTPSSCRERFVGAIIALHLFEGERI